MKGDEIVQPCDQYSNETVTLRKHITKYKNMQKWIENFEFLRKFENRGHKVARVSSILITKSINLQPFAWILNGVGGPLWCDIFTLTASALSINREVCGCSKGEWILLLKKRNYWHPWEEILRYSHSRKPDLPVKHSWNSSLRTWISLVFFLAPARTKQL